MVLFEKRVGGKVRGEVNERDEIWVFGELRDFRMRMQKREGEMRDRDRYGVAIFHLLLTSILSGNLQSVRKGYDKVLFQTPCYFMRR